MVKNYENFITESKFSEIEEEFHTVGEYVEKMSKDDDYLVGIISNYIDDFDTDIRIANAVNLLEDFDKKQLFYRVYNYINRGRKEKNKEHDVMSNIVFENIEVKAGKNIFTSFLKSLTALGQSSISKLETPPNDFLMFYKSVDIEVGKVKSILSRFKSLSMYLDLIDYTLNSLSLYYGIKDDLTFEYGFFFDKVITIGDFKINKSNLNWLLLNQSPSSMALKKDIVSLDIGKLVLMSKITNEMKSFNLPCQKKTGPTIDNEIITFGFYGIGKWDNGKLDVGEYENIKTNFKNWLMKFRWSDRILINLTYNDFWIYLNIKFK
jgi:hypothetical protein